MVPKTVRDILERHETGRTPAYLTLDDLAGIDPRSYTECKARVSGFTTNYHVTLTPQQAHDLARMSRILHCTETYAVTKEEFRDISERLAGCPKELVRESAGGTTVPSVTARAAKYTIKRKDP
jgi:hypothetical protein